MGLKRKSIVDFILSEGNINRKSEKSEKSEKFEKFKNNGKKKVKIIISDDELENDQLSNVTTDNIKNNTNGGYLQKQIVFKKSDLLNKSNENELKITKLENSPNLNSLRNLQQNSNIINSSDLAIHPGKIFELKKWLQDSIKNYGQTPKLLILSGPSGSGKSTSLKTLCNDLGLSIIEWENSINPNSQENSFSDFIYDSKYGSIEQDFNTNLNLNSNLNNKLLLIEDLPIQAYINQGQWKQNSFINPILEYLSGNSYKSAPLVIILSDVESEVYPDFSTDPISVFGSEILTDQFTTIIKFNPIAKTYMKKGLKTLLFKNYKKPIKTSNILNSDQIIDTLSNFGDLKAAINALNMYMVSPDLYFALDIAHRETYHGLFHAVGKVVYNSRSDVKSKKKKKSFTKKENYNTEKDDIDVQSIVQEYSRDKFIINVFENYCVTNPDVSIISEMASYASDCDLLSNQRNNDLRINSETKIDPGLEICIRGVMYSLKANNDSNNKQILNSSNKKKYFLNPNGKIGHSPLYFSRIPKAYSKLKSITHEINCLYSHEVMESVLKSKNGISNGMTVEPRQEFCLYRGGYYMSYIYQFVRPGGRITGIVVGSEGSKSEYNDVNAQRNRILMMEERLREANDNSEFDFNNKKTESEDGMITDDEIEDVDDEDLFEITRK